MKSSSKKVTIACVIISVLIIFVVFFCMTISLKKTNSQNNSESTYQYTGTTISSDETQILVTTNYQSKIDYTIEETVDYPQNSNGETYGSALDASSFNNNIPDLISVKGKNGIRGYVQKDDFLHIELLDGKIVPHAIEQLKRLYPHLLQLTYVHLSQYHHQVNDNMKILETMELTDLYQQFYQTITNQQLDEESLDIIKDFIEKEK